MGVDALGKDLEYVVGLDEWYVGLTTPGNANFVRNFQSRFGYVPTRIESKGYATAQIVVAALERAPAISSDAVRDFILKGDIPTILGPVTFRDNGQRHPRNVVGQIQGGDVVIVSPPEVKSGTAKPAPSWSTR